jgi:hypothetical protein
VTFRDRGFRLAVIDALWNLGHFKTELERARGAGGEPDDFGHDPAIEAEIDKIVLTPPLLAEIEKLAPDGGDEIYDVLGGGGDCRAYDVASLDDVALLPNLRSVRLFAMCRLDVDLAPLATVPKLAEVRVDLGANVRAKKLLAQLVKRGVKIA